MPVSELWICCPKCGYLCELGSDFHRSFSMWLSDVQSYVNLSVAEFHTHRSLFSMTPSPEGNARSSPFLSKGILLMWPSRPILPVSIHTVLVPIQPFDNRLDERRWFFLLPHHLLNRSGTFTGTSAWMSSGSLLEMSALWSSKILSGSSFLNSMASSLNDTDTDYPFLHSSTSS